MKFGQIRAGSRQKNRGVYVALGKVSNFPRKGNARRFALCLFGFDSAEKNAGEKLSRLTPCGVKRLLTFRERGEMKDCTYGKGD